MCCLGSLPPKTPTLQPAQDQRMLVCWLVSIEVGVRTRGAARDARWNYERPYWDSQIATACDLVPEDHPEPPCASSGKTDDDAARRSPSLDWCLFLVGVRHASSSSLVRCSRRCFMLGVDQRNGGFKGCGDTAPSIITTNRTRPTPPRDEETSTAPVVV